MTRADPSPRSGRTPRPVWQETLLLVALALVLAVGVKAFLLQAFYIPSESMEPGLVEHDRILVQKVSYWGEGEPERGDVVVFEDPGGWLDDGEVGPDNVVTRGLEVVGLYPAGGHLVKRVVGVEGDTVECCDEQGRLQVNGAPVEEASYVAAGAECAGPMVGNCSWSAGPVPEGHLFVMGDNRSRSADSTVHMCRPDRTDCVEGREFVPEANVVGRVLAIVWPTSHLSRVERPHSFDQVPEAGP